MKETVKEIFEDLKDRSTNPFITSFILSWLIYNWKIAIGLIFYSQAEMSKTVYKTFFGLIDMQMSSDRMLIYPILWALTYTFILSAGKQLIIGYQDYLVSRRKNIVYSSTKDHQSITVSYFEKVKAQLEEDAVKFAKLVKEESKITLENDELKKKVAEHDALTVRNYTDHLKEINSLTNEHNETIQELQSTHQKLLQTSEEASRSMENVLSNQIKVLAERNRLLQSQVADLPPDNPLKKYKLTVFFHDRDNIKSKEGDLRKAITDQFSKFGVQGYGFSNTEVDNTLIYTLSFKHKLRETDKKLIIFEIDRALAGYNVDISLL